MSDSVEAGKVVITGAGGGIGLGLAQEFARRGFDVVALLRDATKRTEFDKALAGLEDRVEVQQLDVRNAADYQMPQDVSILVNNAGIRYEYLPVEEIPMAEWREYFEVNFFGVVELCRLAIPPMRQAGRGIICNINSSSLFYPMPFLAPYRATKGAMAALTESLRAELAPFGIRVTEIFPGPVASALSAGGILHRTPAAANYPPYAPLAHSQRAAQQSADLPIYQPSDVAPAMVDHILGSTGVMRDGTCDMSRAALENWRTGTGGEPLMNAFITSMMSRVKNA
jgi:NAD(P)-dependent dehydrogenase (short-subunit alcohol dehydrogenase family)